MGHGESDVRLHFELLSSQVDFPMPSASKQVRMVNEASRSKQTYNLIDDTLPVSESKDRSLLRIRCKQLAMMLESCLMNGEMKPQPVKNWMKVYSMKKSGDHSRTTRMHGRIVDASAARAERHASTRIADIV